LDTADDGMPPGNLANGPDGDPDGDGLLNFVEFLVGLDPFTADVADFPSLTVSSNPDDSKTLEFPSIPDRLYTLFWGPDLQTWTQLGPVISSGSDVFPALYRVDDDGPPKTPVHPGNVERRFYRLEIALP
ncbi:MAG: hypothetical protein VCA73_12395, partial [Roseibacillus sp.]